jgi:phosphopantetheinyl transferase (holo-ACP synthase)
VRLHGSAAERAAAIGIAAIAVSITHEREYAVAVAYGQRAVREA